MLYVLGNVRNVGNVKKNDFAANMFCKLIPMPL